MAKTYYKVVMPHPETKELLSAVSAALPDKWVTTYKPGEWTEAPNDSGLFVFETLGMAEAFQGGFAGLRRAIWECECEDPVEIPGWIPKLLSRQWDLPHVANLDSIQRYWATDANVKNTDIPWQMTPPFTALFRRVKLTKQIS